MRIQDFVVNINPVGFAALNVLNLAFNTCICISIITIKTREPRMKLRGTGAMTAVNSRQFFSFTKVIVVMLALVLVLSFPAYSHHSASQYDFGQPVQIHGTVKQVSVVNPHIELILEIINADGTSKEVEFEGHSRNNVFRRGWRPDMLHEGDEITISISPKRDGEDVGYINSFTLADGRQF